MPPSSKFSNLIINVKLSLLKTFKQHQMITSLISLFPPVKYQIFILLCWELARKRMSAFWFSHIFVTLHEFQNHSNLYKNLQSLLVTISICLRQINKNLQSLVVTIISLRQNSARIFESKLTLRFSEEKYRLPWILELNKKINAQTSHICNTYRSSLKTSPLHNKPSQMFGLFYAILQQSDCISSRFHKNLWPWVKVKVIQTGIIL